MAMAMLGRERVFIIRKNDLEHPSDTDGILYEEYHSKIAEVYPTLQKRLKDLKLID